MRQDITLGQYFPKDSVIHRLDPRSKLMIVCMYIVALFLAVSWVSYGLVLVWLLCAVRLSQVGLRAVFRGLRTVVVFIALISVFHIFFTDGDHVLLRFWKITVTFEGCRAALFLTVRIVLLIAGTFLLTYTTSPMMLTDGLERLLNPLKKIKFPVHDLAMMMSLALRFIPTLIEEMDKIMSAQRARGADFESGGLIRRAKALLPLLIPLFFSAVSRAMELANAMECRCYCGGEGRTKLHPLSFCRQDWIAIGLCLTLTVSVGVLGIFGL